jgi:pimeloyl-ACP methyl ester carboxylesterase
MSLLFRLTLLPLTLSVSLTVSLVPTQTGLAAVKSGQCFIPNFESAARCVEIAVPRDWERPQQGEIAVAAAIVPGLGGGRARAPLLVLPGGPGQAGTDLGPLIDTAFGEARADRDIILFDPRGTGRSMRLRCTFDPGIGVFDATPVADAGERCYKRAASFGREGALRAVAQDIEALRSRLDIPRLDLWGGSYGTKYAQAYARLYPDRVRSIVLDGAISVDESILTTAAGDADRAWNRLVQDCRAANSCDAAYPALDAEAFTLLRTAAARPLHRRIHDPVKGIEQDVVFDRVGLSNAIRGALYVPRFAALLPFAISRAASGDLSALAALNAAGASWSTDTMALGATAAVMCSEEAPLARSAKAGPGRLIGNSYADYWLALCRKWPAGRATFGAAESKPLGMPALILAGALDPITPPARAQRVARGFRDARIAVAPAGGHTISTLGCAPQLIARFLDDGSPRRLDTACLRIPATRPPFVIDASGSARAGVSP